MTETRTSAREWRFYVVAAIAGLYVLVFSRIRPAATPFAATPVRAIWLDDLPPEARPVLSPPAGWRVADRHDTATPTLRRVAPSGAARVRTRSS